MKKTFLTIFTIIGFAACSFSQESADSTNWKLGGAGGFNFNQVSLTNWAAGGNSSLSGVAYLNVFANWKKDNVTWDNSLDLGFGMVKQGDDPFVKSDDRIELNSKYGRSLREHWYLSGLLNFRTQFAEGYGDAVRQTPKISDFMAPGYLLLAIGFDYKPSDNLSIFISPLTNKYTFVMDQGLADAGQFGVDPATFDDLGVKTADGSNVRAEFGGYFKMAYNRDLMENVNFQTKVDLFSNYLEKPQNIDVNWEVAIAMKVNKYITANLNTLLIYDDDIDVPKGLDENGIAQTGPGTQFKQVFGLGFSYKF